MKNSLMLMQSVALDFFSASLCRVLIDVKLPYLTTVSQLR